ncbi:hypothetical protein A0O34_07050 [Chryseobacterium glaciei]|uniref:Uncharacterized protein n=1 Tax=Chryseobacterium glaciei TaxID=1685010 RepID=A0A172XTE1_9FLAO|nr:hypothetical protein [Chryseobacterium glaciei]ANF50287.1 hypothetical protein A0O34_07050 [Chryseobacterium glaciei]
MSNLADKTEYRAISIISKMVKDFERLHYLNMTKNDDADACKARNLLEGIIQSNGYKLNYKRIGNRPLLKNQDDGSRK